MREIYARANRVLVWLGTPNSIQLDEKGYSFFLQEAYKIQPTHPLLRPDDSQVSEYFDSEQRREFGLKMLFFATHRI